MNLKERWKEIEWHRGWWRGLIVSINLLLALLLGFIDYNTGHELVFAIFYLLIISFTVVFSGLRSGIIISFFSASVGLFVDISYAENYSSILFPIFNNIFRLCYYIFHTILLFKLISIYKKARAFSLIDSLTGIHNSRSFRIRFQHEIEKIKRTKSPISLVYFDIDNFKEVNDTHGHSTGDLLLKQVAASIVKLIRPMDVLSRLGGDEFALLLPETDSENVKYAVDRVRSEVMMIAGKNNWPITLSIGVVTFNNCRISLDEMIKLADDLMYQVKKEGKNNSKYEICEDVRSLAGEGAAG